jgi:hypothetical protein
MIWIYKLALLLPGKGSTMWGIDKLISSGSPSGVPTLLRILVSDSYFSSPQFCQAVRSLAGGSMHDRRLADEIIARYKERAEQSPGRPVQCAFVGLDTLARAIFATGGEEILPSILAMATDKNPTIRTLAFKVFETSHRVEGLKPLLAVAGSVFRNGGWDDDAFNSIRAISEANGVGPLCNTLEALMRELDAGTFYGCMSVAGRLLQWLPLSNQILELADDLPLDEVYGTYANALKDPDKAFRVRAAKGLLGRLSTQGDIFVLLEQAKRGVVMSEDDVKQIRHVIYNQRQQADTMLEKMYRQLAIRLKHLPWNYAIGAEAERIANQGGVTFHGKAKATHVVLMAPVGLVHDGKVDYHGRLNGVPFQKTYGGSNPRSDTTEEVSDLNYMITEFPFSAYIDGKRTSMIFLSFIPLEGGESPVVEIDKITAE